MSDEPRGYLTVRQLADDLGCDPRKVLVWIRAGELAAVNIAERATGRPRWRIPREAWERFLAARSNRASGKPRRPTRRQAPATGPAKAYY